jgi:hypothetical protein
MTNSDLLLIGRGLSAARRALPSGNGAVLAVLAQLADELGEEIEARVQQASETGAEASGAQPEAKPMQWPTLHELTDPELGALARTVARIVAEAERMGKYAGVIAYWQGLAAALGAEQSLRSLQRKRQARHVMN